MNMWFMQEQDPNQGSRWSLELSLAIVLDLLQITTNWYY